MKKITEEFDDEKGYRFLIYLRQQNKCYHKGVYLPISKLHSILAAAREFT